MILSSLAKMLRGFQKICLVGFQKKLSAVLGVPHVIGGNRLTTNRAGIEKNCFTGLPVSLKQTSYIFSLVEKSKMSAVSIALSPDDPSSFSLPDQCRCVDLHLKLNIDFERKSVSGVAEYTCEKKDDVEVLVLDTDTLTINKVYCKETGAPLEHTLSEAIGRFGSKLEIKLLPSFEKTFTICIDFASDPKAMGLQWMSKEHTMGKKLPYMFSQFQSIYARTMFPCQDTPNVKHPYKADVTVDEEFTVLMSAVAIGSETDAGKKTFSFIQKVPIPVYLIAIAVGNLVSKEIGPRSKVWTEPEMLEAAASEFEPTEIMLKTAEGLCGKYIWGVYDLLVLPPSFPFGGMENPCLTFVTPTLIAGDRSLTGVIAHEIAHSWTGNLVTNKNWVHFWLNEGHTVFVERKIIGRMYGEKSRQFDNVGGWLALAADVETYPPGSTLTKLIPNLTGVHPDEAFSSVPYEKGDALLYHLEALLGGPGKVAAYPPGSPLTKLLPDLVGVHPDDAFCRVPYDKGAALLYYIEQLLGGPDVFEEWLRAYITKFSGKSLTTDEWKDFLYGFFSDKHDILNSVDWEGWLNTPGMPPLKPEYDYTMSEACQKLCNRWLNSDLSTPETSDDYDAFSAKQKSQFLDLLLAEKKKLSKSALEAMNSLYKIADNRNAEIISRWYQLCAGSDYLDNLPDQLKFLRETGRMKFVRPCYRALYANENSRPAAIENFLSVRDQMHPITANRVAEDLHIQPE